MPNNLTYCQVPLAPSEIKYIERLARKQNRSRASMLRQVIIEHQNFHNEKPPRADLPETLPSQELETNGL